MRGIYVAVGVVALCIVIIFVGRAPSNASVVGTYQRVFLGVKETISLNPDGSFEQTLNYPNGVTWKTEGKWMQIERAIQLDKSYYYCNDDTGGLVDPPIQNSSVTFEIIRDGLSREMQIVLRKSSSPN